MSLPVTTTPEADVQIETIDAWWREHRTAAPDLFAEELAACFELLSAAPDIGPSYHRAPQRGIRRLLLRSTRYHVYYIHQRDSVTVLAVWHARRGTGPTLS